MYLTERVLLPFQSKLSLDVMAFAPEVLLCVGLVLVLFLRLFKVWSKRHMGWVALAFTLMALLITFARWPGNILALTYVTATPTLQKWSNDPGMLGAGSTLAVGALDSVFQVTPEYIAHIGKSVDSFTGMLAYDNLTNFVRLFLLSFTALLIWLSMLTGIPDREDSADFYCLLLGATLGMSIMASANHLLMVFIGVEMASLPSYALAGFLKGRRQSSEAALKYVVYGGGAAGVMLYGISLIAGKFGTGYLPDVAQGLLLIGPHAGMDPVLLLGLLFVMVGFAFKLSAVPFHFWCPDVFEGAAAEVGAFLSVASKGAALALTARFALMLAGVSRVELGADFDSWLDVAQVLAPALAILAGITATFGNLAAYAQHNIKRLLAYSTIAHAGYMLMGLATLSRAGAAAVLFYLVAYLFMNLGAFAVVAFLRNLTGSEELSSYRGMIQRAPLLTVLFGIFLLSLLGMPPLAGFAAKFQIFSVLYRAGQDYSVFSPALGYTMYALLVVGGLNTAISAVYYIKVLRIMVLERTPEQLEGETPEPLPVSAGSAFFTTLLAGMLLILGILWNPLSVASDRGVNRFHAAPQPGSTAKKITEGATGPHQ